jgi:uncharacterized protein
VPPGGWAPPPPAGSPVGAHPPFWAQTPHGWVRVDGASPAPLPVAVEIDFPLGSDDGTLSHQLEAGAAPATRGSAWLWLLFGLIGFLAGQVLAAILVVTSAAATGHLRDITAITKLSEPPTWFVVSTLVGLWAGFLGAPWLSSVVRGTRSLTRDVGLRFKWIDLLGIPIGVGGQFLIAAIYLPIVPHVHNFQQRFNAPGQKITGASHGVGYLVIGICTVVGAPFFEEVFFRGLLLRSFTRLFGRFLGWVGPVLAIVVTGTLFGLAHAESLQLLGLATFGIILSFISYRSGRLGMNMVAHAAFNLFAVAATLATLAPGRGVPF